MQEGLGATFLEKQGVGACTSLTIMETELPSVRPVGNILHNAGVWKH